MREITLDRRYRQTYMANMLRLAIETRAKVVTADNEVVAIRFSVRGPVHITVIDEAGACAMDETAARTDRVEFTWTLGDVVLRELDAREIALARRLLDNEV